MSKFNLETLHDIDGYVCAALVDSESGMMLDHDGSGLDLETAAAGNTEVVKAKRDVIKDLKLKDDIEDILISLNQQYHLIRPLESERAVFVYLVLDRDKSNLALARVTLRRYEHSVNLG